jgi:hypothetical protein
MAQKPVYVIDGTNFSDFAGFIEECNHSFIRAFGGEWNGNLDAFNDFLWWSNPDIPEYVLVWRNSAKSQADLGHQAMVGWLAENLKHCHPDNIPERAIRLQNARLGRGPTLFDELVDIIRFQEHVELWLE